MSLLQKYWTQVSCATHIKINDEKAQTNLAKQNLCVVVTEVKMVENNTLRNDGMIQELTPPFVPIG